MRRFLASLTLLGILLPVTSFALEGIGPRVTITGIIDSVTVTKEQKDLEYGGTVKVRASNGQLVTVLLNKETEIIAEGRSSRHQRLPADLQTGTDVRIRGWRLGTDSMTASLVIVTNASLNPLLSTSGILQAISEKGITVIGQNGVATILEITNETEVTINYTIRGMSGLNLIGKNVIVTINPNNAAQARVIRITDSSVSRGLPVY